MLAASFIAGGLEAFRHPGSKAPTAASIVAPVVDAVPQLSSTEQVVRLDAAVKVAAGTLLAFGRFPRLSATALAASLIPTTLAGHRFWDESDPAKRKVQRLHFIKNAGLLGGLLLAAVDTEGRPSLGWRAKHAPAAISHAASDLRRDSELALHSAANTVRNKLPVG